MVEKISLTINGYPTQFTTDINRPLLWVLRTDLGLAGTKYGCGEGHCGACTILLNNDAVRSCQLTIGDATGNSITTIEGLSKNGILHPVQQAFVNSDALQCGFCTPGMVLQTISFLNKNPNPNRKEIIAAMDDSLCRCGAHSRILQAIEKVVNPQAGRRAQ
jgi:aerobic-type carbon monoxide dehydrogenase small subunit (CoxS/CutS family)